MRQLSASLDARLKSMEGKMGSVEASVQQVKQDVEQIKVGLNECAPAHVCAWRRCLASCPA